MLGKENDCNMASLPRIEYLKDVQKQEAPFYKTLTDSVHKALETPNDKEAINILSEELQTSDEHFKPYLQQAVLDSNFMIKSAFIAKKRAQSLDTNHYKFDSNTFASRLLNKQNRLNLSNIVSSEFERFKIDFETIGQKYGYCMQSVPSFNFLFGAFDFDDVVKHKRSNRKANDFMRNEGTIQPRVWTKGDDDDDDDDSDNESTPHEVDILFKRLCKDYRSSKKNPLNYFDFVTDESSFSSTVENIFHSSFLAKGGYINLTLNSSDSRHKIEPLKRNESDENNDQSCNAILTFTKNDWFNWIEEY